MSEYERKYNVSVRLNKEDYEKLKRLQEKFDRISKSKVALADVLREGVIELYLKEIETEPFSDVSELEKKYSIEEVSEEEIEDEYARSLRVDDEKILKPVMAAEHKNEKKTGNKSNVTNIVQSSLEEEKKRKEREAKLKEGVKPSEEILKRSKTNK